MSYKEMKSSSPIDGCLAQRSGKTKGTDCRLPGPGPYGNGKADPHLNPNFEVQNQDEPTAAHPVSQHKNLAGMQKSKSFGKGK